MQGCQVEAKFLRVGVNGHTKGMQCPPWCGALRWLLLSVNALVPDRRLSGEGCPVAPNPIPTPRRVPDQSEPRKPKQPHSFDSPGSAPPLGCTSPLCSSWSLMNAVISQLAGVTRAQCSTIIAIVEGFRHTHAHTSLPPRLSKKSPLS